ncbi:NACHT, LRR and PYD domains-containing protein 12-like [Engraulis encrasicolus]|uniref:NACHT, LRR and PYD domains-containing protein 12-like n=1 Tax=Engraulis encrasicolus TaxID=184585 RepID=UPI002FCF690E
MDQESACNLKRVIEAHKTNLRRGLEHVSDGGIKSAAETLHYVHTELYNTEEEGNEADEEPEIWQVATVSKARTTEGVQINPNDLFNPLDGLDKQIRTIITKGVAGIGKTVSVQKFILDWTNGVANQNVDFIFPLSVPALTAVRDDVYSLHNLLLDFYPELKQLRNGELYEGCQVLFIFDGLDDGLITFNFKPILLVSDVKQKTSVDLLISSLIQGTLLPTAQIWITSRPAAVRQIPSQCVSQVTEILGFNPSQQEEYLRKSIRDESQADRIISHIKASWSLHILWHIPFFCWILSTVLQEMLKEDHAQDLPRTLTEVFIRFLLTQTAGKDQTCHNGTKPCKFAEFQKQITWRLARLAFKNLQKGNLVLYEEDLRSFGIDVSEAAMHSGVCNKIFQEESVFQQRKVYCFVHLSIQEFLAALHIFACYSDQMALEPISCLKGSLKRAVKTVLKSRNGHFSLFLHLLLGICLEDNQRLLKGLLKSTHNTSESIKEVCRYIKQLNKEYLSSEKYISVLHSLFEVNDDSIYEESQQYLKSSNGVKDELSPAHCSAMAHMLMMSDDVLDEFDLKNYNTSDEGRRRLLLALSCSRTARLGGCKLNRMACETVRKCLQSPNYLVLLDLSHSGLGDSGVQLLAAGLTSPHCKLQILSLVDCELSHESCKILASMLLSVTFLKELDLSHNDIQDSGVQHLSKELASLNCKLQVLRLSGCLISEQGCTFLATALTSNPSHLKELHLNYNHPGESGRKLLSTLGNNKLETLVMDHCENTRLRRGVRKYTRELTVNENSAHKMVSYAAKEITSFDEEQAYPDHPERFDWWLQWLYNESITGRCYWEVEWSGVGVYIAVVYNSMERKGESGNSMLGKNSKSWSLYCSQDKDSHSYSAWHNDKEIVLPVFPSCCRRVGVYLDRPAGILSFYSVSSDTLTHLHTFNATFTEPLYPGFGIFPKSTVRLCQI